MDEDDEIRRLRQRDPQAWERLYRDVCRRTYRVLFHVTKAETAVLEELNQSVWLAAMEAIERFDATRGTPSEWLMGIARLQGLGYLRRQYRRRVFSAAGAVETWEAPNRERDGASAHEQSGLLRACIEALPEQWQFVLRQKYEVGLSVKEIADLCGSSVKAVESVLSRARNRLRQWVAETRATEESA
jgi:RNA polymerase sigma-70 factor (ECF subfamily)